MSWPGEEWKVGLPPPALRAIAEVEQRLERVQKERQQKQVQLDTLEAVMHKQRQKHEEEKASWALLSQENRSLAEACEQADRARQRLAQELQAKDGQLSCLEAQLAQATRRQAELEEELRRCQVELEKLQSQSHLVLLSPRWGSPTPWAEGAVDTKTDNGRIPAAGTAKTECSSPPVGEPCTKDMLSEEAAFPSSPRESPDPTGKGDGALSGASELASTGEELKADNQESRLALAQAESRLQEKAQERWRLQGHVEVSRLELAQWKKQRGRADLAEPARTQDGQGRRLSEDVGRLRRSREQEKGLAGTERMSSGSTRRSVSSSRLEQLAEKRGSATRQKGLAFQSPKGPTTERSLEELQALRVEVLALRRRLEASESQRKTLLESCWQQQRTRAWVQERQTPLLGLRVASWQRRKEASRHQTGKKPQALEGREVTGKRGALGSGGEEVLEAQTEQEGPEEAEPEMGTPNTPAGRAKAEAPCLAKAEELNRTQDEAHAEGKPDEPGEATEGWRETIRTLAAGKAEAEAQAGLAQQKLQSLQATLGLQTERLSQALEAQSRHVEELVADAEEKERLVDSLRRELEDTKTALDAAHGEAQSLRALLEEKEEELRCVGAKTAPGLAGDGEATLARGDKAGMARNGLAARAQKDGHEQAELETFLAQLLRENQALRHELIHWEAMIVEKGDLDSCSISSTLHGEAMAANVLQASQKVALLIQESQRDVQTQTEGPEAGVQHRRRERVSVAFDDTQYEPYGLPEVVMKGFADIPSGPSCPYVLRRGILGSAPVAQLAPKAEPEEDGLEAEEEASL